MFTVTVMDGYGVGRLKRSETTLNGPERSEAIGHGTDTSRFPLETKDSL